ncbi:MAG TPA: CBS domain-containing protein, partial [Burkholderiales bacterium]|nr:CBS domain-containing protein [Burkholderiales bacterium]
MAISEFCHRNVVCATRETTVTEAANLMRQHHIGDVIIVETRGGKRVPVGIVTDRD